MRIREYSKECGLSNNEILEILEKNNITGKTAASGISDEEIAIIKKASGAAAPKAEAPKAEAPKVEAPKAAEPKAAGPKAEEKSEAGDKNNQQPLKKKKMIIISDNGNNKPQNQNQNQGQRPQGDRRPNQQNNAPRGPIKPRENMVDRAAAATSRREMAEREQQKVEDEARAREQAALAAAEAAKNETKNEAAEATQARPIVRDNIYNNRDNRQGGFNRDNNRDNRQGGFNRDNNRDNRQGGFNRDNNRDNRQGGFNRDNNRDNRQGGFNRDNNRDNRQGGFNRDNNRDNRQGGDNRNKGGVIISQGNVGGRGFNARPGQKPNMGGGKGYAESAIPENNDRRRDKASGKERDSRSKKDQLYEDDEIVLGKGRNSKAGRFIKPEKVKEEVVEEEIKVITIPEMITIKDLAEKMKIQPSAIVKKLFMQGKMVTVNQEVSFEEAEEIAIEYEIMCEMEEKVDIIAELLKEEDEAEENLVSRPPVICVMGHVDHGKTSLLDAIRNTNVTEREAGGITQAIGAYTVKVNDRKITFLDTPGHEAFTSMRMRGANSTDIAILVVAADDGVMPQTIEAINHAKAAGIEIIVAVNKIDKPGANIDRVKQELTEYELVAEDWGGQTIFAPVSAKTGEGIEDLLEMILLTADVLDLKSNPNRKARGLVIEAELDKGRGPVATVLVQKGTLQVGDFISAGAASGKVRAMVDDKGRRVKEAGPSTPVEILGLNDVPNAGEIFICHDNDKQAKSYAETFIAQNKAKLLEETKSKMSLDDLYSKIQEGNLKELNIIIKADVQGSVEAVKQSLMKLSNDEVVVKVIHGGVGAINESDVVLASASQAIIIGFNVRPDTMAKSTAEREGVDVRLYKVIYQAIEEMEAAMKGMLDAVYEEKVIGHAEVQQIFKASAIGNIAGSRVMDGMIQRDCKVRITREGELIFEGELKSLKRFKDDVKEVKEGFECGLVFEDFDQMQEHDMVEAYIMVEVPRD